MSPPPSTGHSSRAPDGGWGWVVCFASFVLQALTIGITYTFGVLFVDLLEYFKESEATTAWIGSIQPCLLYFTGIIAGPLIQKFGWRTVTICGSVLSAIGFATSALAQNIYTLYFTYGVITGLGNGLMYVTSMVAVQHYFDKKRARATGLAVSGSGVGTLFFGFMTRYLLDNIGWRWTLVVEGGIMLLGVLCGAALRPLPELTEEKAPLTESGEYRVHHEDPQPDTPLIHVEQQGRCAKYCGAWQTIFDTRLLRNPVFILFCVGLVLFCFGYHVPYTYTPERAEKAYNIDSKAASMLVSIMGLANVASRLIFGWVGDKSTVVRFYLGGGFLTLGGVVSILIFLFNTYPTMIVYSVLFGAFTGCWVSLFPVILVDLLGVENIETSLGQCMFVSSGAFLVASPLSGLIISKTGNYDSPFMVVGVAETVGGMAFFCIRLVERYRRHQSPPIPEAERRHSAATLRRQRSFISESFS